VVRSSSSAVMLLTDVFIVTSEVYFRPVVLISLTSLYRGEWASCDKLNGQHTQTRLVALALFSV